MQFRIDFGAFLESLPLMLKGMLGIFLVIAVIYGFIVLLNKAFGGESKKQ